MDLLKPGDPILVMDLLRPETPEAAQCIVDEQAAGKPEQLQQDFCHLLLSALTENKVRRTRPN